MKNVRSELKMPTVAFKSKNKKSHLKYRNFWEKTAFWDGKTWMRLMLGVGCALGVVNLGNPSLAKTANPSGEKSPSSTIAQFPGFPTITFPQNPSIPTTPQFPSSPPLTTPTTPQTPSSPPPTTPTTPQNPSSPPPTTPTFPQFPGFPTTFPQFPGFPTTTPTTPPNSGLPNNQCSSNTNPSIQPNEIRIQENCRYQTLDGIGVNSFTYPFANDIGYQWNAVKFAYDELDLHYVRFFSWFQYWEPQNDNADPNVIDWSKFDTFYGIINRDDVGYAQWLTQRTNPVQVQLGVWDTADWLATGNPRQIPVNMYPELGESIATYLLNMQSHGVPQQVVEVQNEPDIAANIQYSKPEALRDAALAVLDKLDSFGLSKVMLHGPNTSSPVNAAAWAQVWLANSRLRDRTAAISYHTWWSKDRATYDAIWQVAQQYGKPVWATEVGGMCAVNDTTICGNINSPPLQTTTWDTAFDYAQGFYRAIDWSHASRLYFWSLLGNDAAVGPQGQRNPTFYVLKHYANYIPSQAVYVKSNSGQSGLLTMAFLLPTGGRSLIVVNTTNGQLTMNLTSTNGGNSSVSQAITSTNGNYLQPTITNTNGQLSITFPAQSITSLRLP